MEIVIKDWTIKQNERGDGTSLIQVFCKDRQVEVFVANTMSKQKLRAYLQKKVKDADISL